MDQIEALAEDLNRKLSSDKQVRLIREHTWATGAFWDFADPTGAFWDFADPYNKQRSKAEDTDDFDDLWGDSDDPFA